MRSFFKQFFLPRPHRSHCHPGNAPARSMRRVELGYVLLHACGAVFDNPRPDSPGCVRLMARPKNRPLGHLLDINKFPQPDQRRRRAAV